MLRIIKIISIFCIVSILFCSCSKVSEQDVTEINKAVDATNEEQLYDASFVFEVIDLSDDETVMFVQGSYSIDKNNSEYNGPILNGSLVQTVNNSPSSLKIAFFDDTYVTISKDYKILSDMESSVILNQFMCAPALSFDSKDIVSIESSEVSDGTMYVVEANYAETYKSYFDNFLGDDIYALSGMKKAVKELTEYKNIRCKYVVSDDQKLVSRELSYTVIAYDTVPYFPGNQADKEDYKRTFDVSLKFNYKNFGNEVKVDITEFLPDTSTDEK